MWSLEVPSYAYAVAVMGLSVGGRFVLVRFDASRLYAPFCLISGAPTTRMCSNISHAEASSRVTSSTKTMLMVQHGVVYLRLLATVPSHFAPPVSTTPRRTSAGLQASHCAPFLPIRKPDYTPSALLGPAPSPNTPTRCCQMCSPRCHAARTAASHSSEPHRPLHFRLSITPTSPILVRHDRTCATSRRPLFGEHFAGAIGLPQPVYQTSCHSRVRAPLGYYTAGALRPLPPARRLS